MSSSFCVSPSRSVELVIAAAVLALPGTVEGQLLDRLRDRVEEALTEAVECVLGDRACIEEAEASGQDVVVTDARGNPIEDSAAAAGASAPAGDLEAEVTREVLGELRERGAVYVLSPDGAHAAVPGLQGSRQVVVVDGVAGPTFDEVDFGTFAFSETGGRHAYVARRGRECIVVVNHEEREVLGPGGSGCALYRETGGATGARPAFKFNRDGTHVSWVRILATGQAQVVFDGVAGPEVFSSGLTWAVRGDHVFYATGSPMRGGAEERMYVDHEPGPPYRAIHGFGVTDDGEHYVYHAVDAAGSEHVVVDGVEQGGYDGINDLVLDVRSGAVFYTGRRAGEVLYVFDNQAYNAADVGGTGDVMPLDRNVVVTGGRAVSHLVGVAAFPTGCTTVSPSTPFSDCSGLIRQKYAIVFSPDGSRHALRTRSGLVYADGEPSLEYESVTDLGFTSDGSTLVFIASTGGRSFVVVNGEELGPFDRASSLTFSETGNGWAFKDAIPRGEQWYVRGEPVGRSGDLGDLFFSPDGSRFAFASRAGTDPFVVVDGETLGHGLGGFVAPGIPPTSGGARVAPYATAPFLFSATNRLVYIGEFQQQNRAVIVDGERVDEISIRNAANLAAFSPTGAHFAYLRGEQRQGEPMLWRLVVDGRVGPVVADAPTANPFTVSFADERTVRVVGFLDGEIVRQTVAF